MNHPAKCLFPAVLIAVAGAASAAPTEPGDTQGRTRGHTGCSLVKLLGTTALCVGAIAGGGSDADAAARFPLMGGTTDGAWGAGGPDACGAFDEPPCEALETVWRHGAPVVETHRYCDASSEDVYPLTPYWTQVNESGGYDYRCVPETHSLLDVWGEGRIVAAREMTTGFDEAFDQPVYNLNKFNQPVSNGPNSGEVIPRLLKVYDWDLPEFPVLDDSVQYVTMMGAPLVPKTAHEILRVLDKDSGVVVFFGLSQSDAALWANETAEVSSDIQEKSWEDYRDLAPFSEISIPGQHLVFGFGD